jgi:hypothetical protein
MTEKPPRRFQELAQDETNANFLAEYWSFLVHNKKWWMLPILLLLGALGLLLTLSGTAAAPFIYTLF